MKRFSLLLVLFAGAPTVPLDGQTPISPAYEVASVKPNKSGDMRIGFGMAPGGRFTITNAPLAEIIRIAYGVQDFQIVGGPDWITSDRFDIVAKAPADAPITPGPPPAPGGPPTPQQLMLRAVLVDRFALKTHIETREMPTYALVMARADKMPGPKLKASTTDCAQLIGDMRARGGPPPAPPRAGEPIPCGMMMGPGNVNAGAMPIAQLAAMLGARLGRIVIDRTGLTGNWDVMLTFQPDQMLPRGPGGPPPPGAIGPPPIDPNAPSLHTAIEEQLGLKLESTKGPVEVLVIDSVSQPTPD